MDKKLYRTEPDHRYISPDVSGCILCPRLVHILFMIVILQLLSGTLTSATGNIYSAASSLTGSEYSVLHMSQNTGADQAEEIKDPGILVNRKNQIIILAMSGVLLIVILLFVMMIRQKNLKYQQRLDSLEQQLFRTQMNPHFIFNSLTNIQRFILVKDTDNANLFLNRFAKLLRNILENSRMETIPLSREIETIQNYLELQKLRHDEKFEFVIEIEDTLDTEDILIPPLMFQPFIENAIEHGLMNKKDKGTVRLIAAEENGFAKIAIVDNGIGREKAMEIRNNSVNGILHTSLSTDLMRERISALNSRNNKKIRMLIEDLFEENGKASGTSVIFYIPV